MNIKGIHLTFEQSINLGEKECYCLQIDVDKYIIPEFPFYFSNNSCEPNCGINNEFQFFALINIKEGEELFWDYSTSMLEKHWTMNCDCRTKSCRKIITDFDLLPKSLQEKYLNPLAELISQSMFNSTYRFVISKFV